MSSMSTQRRKNSQFFNIQAQKRAEVEKRRKEREEAKKKAQEPIVKFPEVEFADNK